MKKIFFLFTALFLFAEDCSIYYEKQQEYIRKMQEIKRYNIPYMNVYSNYATAYGIMYRNCIIHNCLNNDCNKKCLRLFW